MMAARRNGIFDDVQSATHPGPELPRAPRRMRGRVEIAIGALPDPNPVEGEKLKRQKVALNVARDVLLRELKQGRIGNAQFQAGRVFERILETATIGAGAASLERGGGSGDHEAVVAKAIDRAGGVVEAEYAARSACGQRGVVLLRAILGDRQSFAQIAAAERLGAKRGPGKIAAEFREALLALAHDLDRWGAGEA